MINGKLWKPKQEGVKMETLVGRCSEEALKKLASKKEKEKIYQASQVQRKECVLNGICPDCAENIARSMVQMKSGRWGFITGNDGREMKVTFKCLRCDYSRTTRQTEYETGWFLDAPENGW